MPNFICVHRGSFFQNRSKKSAPWGAREKKPPGFGGLRKCDGENDYFLAVS
jgi:hypothetical protein